MEPQLIPAASLISAQLHLGFSGANEVAITPDIVSLLSAGAAVAVGVSGGKDSQACALSTAAYLDQIGHSGPRLLIHSDLGGIEWDASLPACQRLAEHLGWELLVVRRKAGGLIERWEQRWATNVARYRDLSCVRLILPWSSSSMRFCTSEMKAQILSSALKARYPHLPIVSVTGIRRQESSARSKMPVSMADPRLTRKGRPGATWNPIIDWTLDQVFGYVATSGLALHEAYTRYGSSRVSCSFCVLALQADLRASSTCEQNQATYIRLVTLEAASSFSFQSGHWLADVAPHLLPASLSLRITDAKRIAAMRHEVESEIPAHLLYTAGWPTCLPTIEEAHLIASVRRRVASLLNIETRYLSAADVAERYRELMVLKEHKEQKQLLLTSRRK